MTDDTTSAAPDPDSGSDDVQKIISVASQKGWNVQTERMENGGIQFEFSQYTPFGQDFSFEADLTDDDPETLVRNIREYYESFDPDAEAYLWIGPDGHGRNGAPYHIKNTVRDMEAAEEMVYQLYTALDEIF